MTATDKPFGGFAITGYREHGGQEPVAFTATLTLHGKPVASVRNDGTGGCNLFVFQDPEAGDAWTALARASFPDTFEPEDRLFERMHLVGQLNRARTVAFIYDGMDPFENGGYRAFRSNVSFDDAVRYLSGPGHVEKKPSVWVKPESRFVPVTDLVSA